MATGKKTGGRKKGTPNKVTSTLRNVITDIVDDYYNSETFQEDIAKLRPKDRVEMMEKLTVYVVPKLQTTNIDMSSEGKKTIEDKLVELSKEEE